jgi:hypothetical protein
MRRRVDIAIFWVWCIAAIAMNLPESLSGSIWLAR